MPTKLNLERALAVVRISPNHIVLDRITPRPRYHVPDGTTCVRAVYLDTETTGVDPEDVLIEFAVAAFDFDPLSGRIFDVTLARSWLEDPKRPIPLQITNLTGITDEMVRGRSISEREVIAACDKAELIIAHNAGFDRPMVERRIPWFAEQRWACSQYDINWYEAGYSGLSMDYLVMKHARSFHDGHRAAADVVAGVHVLASAFSDGTWPMRELNANANRVTRQIRAVGAPYELKDTLKARGYRWDPGRAGRERAWWIEIPEEAFAVEQAWLIRNVYSMGGGPIVKKLTARERYSERGR